jgi:hypothetical protein
MSCFIYLQHAIHRVTQYLSVFTRGKDSGAPKSEASPVLQSKVVTGLEPNFPEGWVFSVTVPVTGTHMTVHHMTATLSIVSVAWMLHLVFIPHPVSR